MWIFATAMSIFDIIFPSKDPSSIEPDIMFGRFTDTFKPPAKYDAWDRSIQFYEKEQYQKSLVQFLEYLKNDELDNVKYHVGDNIVTFSILQGSKRIEGKYAPQGIFVEAKIAHTKSLHIGFLRRLIEDNYLLKYCRYALDDNDNITIVFNSFTEDASPYKMYYAFKELAVNADKLDDVLVDEFADLEFINTGHLRVISEEEKDIKYRFLQDEINKVFELINTGGLDGYKYPGAISFLLLSLNYQLDYLIKPEGYIMEKLESIHNIFFRGKEVDSYKRNNLIIKEFNQILARTPSECKSEMYETVSAFGVTSPISHKQLGEFIDSELPNMDWYRDNGYVEYAIAIPHYIVGYALFNYGLSLPVLQLFKLYYRVVHDEYFVQLKFSTFKQKNNILDKSEIKKYIKAIFRENKELYPHAKPDLKMIRYDSLIDFSASFLRMVSKLNLERSDHKEVN